MAEAGETAGEGPPFYERSLECTKALGVRESFGFRYQEVSG